MKTKEKRVRMTVRLDDDVYELLKQKSAEFGMPMSQVASIAAPIGLARMLAEAEAPSKASSRKPRRSVRAKRLTRTQSPYESLSGRLAVKLLAENEIMRRAGRISTSRRS